MAQAGVGVEAPLDDGVLNGASGTQWRRDRGRGRGGAAISGLTELCVFAIVSCVNNNFLLISLNRNPAVGAYMRQIFLQFLMLR